MSLALSGLLSVCRLGIQKGLSSFILQSTQMNNYTCTHGRDVPAQAPLPDGDDGVDTPK